MTQVQCWTCMRTTVKFYRHVVYDTFYIAVCKEHDIISERYIEITSDEFMMMTIMLT